MNQSVPKESELQIQPLEITIQEPNEDKELFEDEAIENERHTKAFGLRRARRLLYTSRLCYHIAELTWSFGSFLWLAALAGNVSLFWVSAYQLAGRILVLLLVPFLSAKIDGTGSSDNHRSIVMSSWIVGQHVCVMITILLVYGTLESQRTTQDTQSDADLSTSDRQTAMIFSKIGLPLICLFGGFAEVFYNVLEIAINRDWIVVMAEEAAGTFQASSTSSSSWLQDTNVVLRQIYLGCEIAIPLLTGSLMTLKGDSSLWVVFYLKGISMMVVLVSMHKLCECVPSLQGKPQNTEQSRIILPSLDDRSINSDSSDKDVFHMQHKNNPSGNDESQSRCLDQVLCCYCSDCKIYVAQKGLVGAGLGMGLLYMNIMTFGGTMVAYLAETGSASMALLGLWKGLSNVSAAFGTIAFSYSTTSLENKGLWSLVVMVTCLSVSAIGIGIDQFTTSNNESTSLSIGTVLLISGTIASRMGLWGYDLCVTQLYQNNVPEPLRGKVGGTQTILNNAFEFVPFLLTMVISKVEYFWIVMVVGYTSVSAALCLYFFGTYQVLSKSLHYGRVVSEEEQDDGESVRIA